MSAQARLRAGAFACEALIVGSAPIEIDMLRVRAESARIIVCADGGGDALALAGIVPDVLVGDMDSISPEALRALVERDVHQERYPAEKDKTDLELALDYTLARTNGRIVVLGATGGDRLDHSIGNLLLLARSDLHRRDIRFEDASGEAFAIAGNATLNGSVGDYVSLFALVPPVTGIVTAGLRYAMDDESLAQGTTRGVSNELARDTAHVSVRSGCLLVRHEHPWSIASSG